MKHQILNKRLILWFSATTFIASCNAGIVAKRTSDRALGKRDKTEQNEFHPNPEFLQGAFQLSSLTNTGRTIGSLMIDQKNLMYFDHGKLDTLSVDDQILKTCEKSQDYKIDSSHVISTDPVANCKSDQYQIISLNDSELQLKLTTPVNCRDHQEKCDVLIFDKITDFTAAKMTYHIDQKKILPPKFEALKLPEANLELVNKARVGFKNALSSATLTFGTSLEFKPTISYFYNGKVFNDEATFKEAKKSFDPEGTICSMMSYGNSHDAYAPDSADSGSFPINNIMMSHLLKNKDSYSIKFRTPENVLLPAPTELQYDGHFAQNQIEFTVISNQKKSDSFNLKGAIEFVAFELTCNKDQTTASLSEPITIDDVTKALGTQIILK